MEWSPLLLVDLVVGPARVEFAIGVAVVGVLADAFRTAAQEPAHLKFLDNMDQPLILLTALRTLLADWDHSEPRRRA